MANVRQEYINRTYNALINYQSNVNAQRRRFRNSNYGDQTPIDAKQLDNVPKGKVVLNSQVFEQLIQINDESEKAKAEFSYLLTGITEGQTIKFDNIVWCRNHGNNAEADFSPLLPNLNSYVKAVQEMGVKHAIVCNGHTHPKDLSAYAEDFSLYDMAGYMQMKEENKVFKEGTIDLCGGIMSDLNFNFVFYDDRMQNFYKFNDVVLELETGEQIPLSCYDRKVSRSEIVNRLMDDTEKTATSFRESLRTGVPSLAEQSQLSIQAQRRLELRRNLTNNRTSPNERVPQ